jgi:diguanylate cyclase (GGDEF)-like protein
VSGDSDTTNRHRTVITRIDGQPRAASAPESACLVVIYGAEIGRRIELGQAPLTIGRSSRADLQLDEESVSRQHARIEPDGSAHGYRISDLGSTNGTYVNDVPQKSSPLRHGDQIQIGRSILKFLGGGHIESAYHEEIYRLMTTDGLTQLMNRRAFEEALSRELARATRHDRPLAIALMDIDRFKGVNDGYGHLAGDAILRQLGALLRANLRRNDLAGRLGGEEFGIILPEVDGAGAVVAAEKVRRLVELHRFEFDSIRIPVTISMGVVARLPHDTEALELIRRADELLYAAKRGGRNCVKA